MNTLSPASMGAASYVSRSAGRGKTEAGETGVEAPAEQVTISDAPATERRSGKGLGMIGKAAALLTLCAVMSGCAVTTGGFGPYGYHQETVGVTPNGSVYSQQTQVGPFGVQQQTGVVGPNGAYYYQNGVPYVVPGPMYRPHHHIHCTPPTYWSPGTCY